MFFAVPNIESHIVSPPASDHFFSMRKQTGDRVVVTDFQDTIAQIEITNMDKKDRLIHFRVHSIEKKAVQRHAITLYQARIDKLYLEKLWEVLPLTTFTEIVVFDGERSNPGSYSHQRLENILVRSACQAEKTWLPNITFFSERVYSINFMSTKTCVLACDMNQPEFIRNPHPPFVYDSVIIGPEGGWSQDEMHFFQQRQIPISSLGDVIYPSWLGGFVWNVSKSSYAN